MINAQVSHLLTKNKRIGYACKWMNPDRTSKDTMLVESMNTKGTTLAYLKRQSQQDAYAKLEMIVRHNLVSLQKQMTWLSKQPELMRMQRISSDFLPMYTEPTYKSFYQGEIVDHISSRLAEIGDFVRQHNIRVSTHPGQYTQLNNGNDDILQRSIDDLEYHADLFEWMGYEGWHDCGCVINIHGGGKKYGIQSFVDNLKKVSQRVRNWITIENDEFSFGLDDVLTISDHVAVVLDIHHHLIHSEEYISPDDPRIARVLESWDGIRPKIHYSVSPEDLLGNVVIQGKPDIKQLLNEGYKKTKLRAHSNGVWNYDSNLWALEFLKNFDIMVEAKHKNLASSDLALLYQQTQETDGNQ